MVSPILEATIQSCILASTSCLIGQAITSYKTDTLAFSFGQMLQFAMFSFLNCPPNFVWQTYLENTFPSTTTVPSKRALSAASAGNEKELDREEKEHVIVDAKLHIPNTIAKFVLDQTVGAAANTLMFSFLFAGYGGMEYGQAIQVCKQDFWPLIYAGWKLWPAVSLVNFSMVKSVQTRNLVGALAGMVWNVYLSLMAAR
ncbi:Mpv17/PMP22 family protein [Calycina marina]|uniref:Mpv17/PMP22 family protein n=1 Tax=Calycina marina TaxID=1763456 RepID=A0A9P7Z253_9HELO|nr:Mpv17/PMP22 family protein [Calycina marina]